MPAPLWHWQYFQTRPHNLKLPGNRDHYNGGIYANTWCRTCITSCTSVMEQEDRKALEDGVISEVRPQTEFLRQAESVGDVDAIEEQLVTPSVRSLATQLRQDVLDDEDPLDDESDELAFTTLPKKVRLFLGTQSPILLSDLFDYTRNTGSESHGLDFFKSNGLNNLDAELELYGLVTRDMQNGLEIDDSTV
ncbi:hypothetical protein BN14_08152 [Rhizoctonia solani AG-1 IB]|uniref:Uncharacterized protein n=1 Tax=Thanatephorus cucumeris (strain AG1-IB / isolate 7/3/14) TaxID=1108050 RepID=M5C4U5_THACB|nr:hypothetical protein BN14_08152 [Rhizoctonia solani AG-1 IB]